MALAGVLDAPLIRLQCYEGLDAAQALYDWDFPRQLLHLRAAEAAGVHDADQLEAELYDRRFLVARPLLQALETTPSVLLVDEVDRADDEFEAFLLEVLSDFTISVPELGTIRAETPPVVVVTSNRTREVHDALKRRCLYHWLEHPDLEREVAIIRRRLPEADGRARRVGRPGRAGRARRGPAQAARRRRVARLDRGAGRARRRRPGRRLAGPGLRQPRGVPEVPRGPGAGRRPAGRVGGRGVSTPAGSVGAGEGGDRRRDADAGRLRADAARSRRRRDPRPGAPDGARDRAPGRRATAADLYWAGRLTLCSGPDDLRPLRPGFRGVLRGRAAPPLRRVPPVQVVRPVAVPGTQRDGRADGSDDKPAATASDAEVLRHRDLAGLTAAEREAGARADRGDRPGRGDPRCRGGHRPSHRGALDPRRTVRTMLRRGGEPVRLERRARRPRPRRLVLLLDVSGSMQPYADPFLRFAHAAARAPARHRGLHRRHPADQGDPRDARPRPVGGAARRRPGTVPDWSGGTRLGELLKAFLDRWGQRGLARGAVVLIASDGWERGDAALLGEQMHRLPGSRTASSGPTRTAASRATPR